MSGVLLIAGCGNGSDRRPSPTVQPPSLFSRSQTSGTTTAVTSPPITHVDGTLCAAADVKLALGRGDAAAGSRYRPLLITNVSGKGCTLQGFPGVSYVAGDDGHQVGNPASREGTEGDAVKLADGETAAADIQFVNVHNYDPSVCKPTPVRGLRIYLPQETASSFVPAPGTGCAGTGIPGNQLSVTTIRPA